MDFAPVLAEIRYATLMHKLGNPRIPLSSADVVIPFAEIFKLYVSSFTDKHNCHACAEK